MLAQLPDAAAGDRIEIVGVPEVPGLEVLRIDARARLWRWYHETYSVVVTSGGTFRTAWRHRGRIHDGVPAMLAFQEPGEAHAEVRKREKRDAWRVLLFPPALIEEAAGELGLPASRIHWRAPLVVDPHLHAHVLAVHQALEGEATALERVERVTALLHDLVRDHAAVGTATPPPAASAAGVARARDLLHARWDDVVRLDELVAVSGMGRFQLMRAFHAAVGLPPHAYQLRLRIARAMALIRSGVPLTQVALQTGFADQSHFTRRFADGVGISPARFRRAFA